MTTFAVYVIVVHTKRVLINYVTAELQTVRALALVRVRSPSKINVYCQSRRYCLSGIAKL